MIKENMNMTKYLCAAAIAISMIPAIAMSAEQTAFRKAIPVWPKGQAEEMNVSFGFRTVFDAAKGDRPVLRITGCSDYRIALNGCHVGWGPARAAKGFFRVDEIPLPAKEGRNVLAIEAAGYNCYSYYHINQPSFLQAEVEIDGRPVAATAPAGDFKALRTSRIQKTARYSIQRTFSEAYRLKAGFDGWKTQEGFPGGLELEERPAVKLLPRRVPYADFKINGFKAVSKAGTVFDAKRKTLPIHFVDGIEETPTRSGFWKKDLELNAWDLAQRFTATNRTAFAGVCGKTDVFRFAAGDSVLFDAGLNDTGFLGLRVKCLEPGSVVVKFDEILVGGEVNTTRYKCTNAIVWEFAEPGEYALETFEPYTLRYADVIAQSGAFEMSAPCMRTFKNPKARLAKLDSSDPAIEKIFEAARETYAQNAVDVFTDCPGRERAGWLCDSFFTGRSSILFTGSLEGEDLFLENYLLPESFEKIPDGMFAMCYPGDFMNGRFIPNWAMWLVLEVEEYKKRGGDLRIVEAYRPKFEKLVGYLKTFRNSDGLLENLPSWVFLEWSMANNLVQDVNYPSNMTWAEVLDAMDRLYGMPELAAEAEKVRETVRRQSWTGKWFCDNALRQKDGTLKLSGECTETCQYYAFYFKTATPETHAELWRTLIADFGPKRKETGKYPEIHPSNAFIGNYLRLECLSREGLSDRILDETRGFFLYMADITGTLWENIGTTASCNHGFASHVAVTYRRDILGLKKVDYVNKTVVFEPPENLPLESISMEIPVGDGFISAGWSKKNGRIDKKLRLPGGWSLEK